MNRWKVAFFVALVGWVGSVAVLGFTVLDEGVSLTHQREGYADCEAHRDFLHALARGRVTQATIQATAPRAERELDGQKQAVTASDVRLRYDAQGRYVASQYGASTTPGYQD